MSEQIISSGQLMAARKLLEEQEAIVEEMPEPRRTIYRTMIRAIHVGAEIMRMCIVVPEAITEEEPTLQQRVAVKSLNIMLTSFEDQMQMVKGMHPMLERDTEQ